MSEYTSLFQSLSPYERVFSRLGTAKRPLVLDLEWVRSEMGCVAVGVDTDYAVSIYMESGRVYNTLRRHLLIRRILLADFVKGKGRNLPCTYVPL